ncbi:MAG: glutamate-1-semialdehyde 2,1-aminomutase, partial [Myxococcota bacterium]
MTPTNSPFPGKSRGQRLQRAMQHMPMGVAENYRFWGDDTIFVKSMKGGTLT